MDGRKKRVLIDQVLIVEQMLKKARDMNSHTPPVIDAVEKLAMVLTEVITDIGPTSHAERVADIMGPGSTFTGGFDARAASAQGDGDHGPASKASLHSPEVAKWKCEPDDDIHRYDSDSVDARACQCGQQAIDADGNVVKVTKPRHAVEPDPRD